MKVKLNLENKILNNQTQIPSFNNISINVADNPNLNKGLLNSIISNGTINNYSDEELYVLVSTNLRGLLLNIFERKDQRYIKMIISDRFLRVLIQVVSNIDVDYMNKIYLNKLCYDYLTLDDNSKNPLINDLIYHLAKITNKKHIPILIGAGIPEKIACYIVLSRFSSNNEFLNITRMNFVILTANINFTEQMIVDVYQNLFERVSQLFEATMLDVLDTNEEWYTEAIDERYSLITLAILDILNSLPSDSIKRVLEDYVSVYHTSYSGKETRCDLRCLSGDYERIRNIVEEMIANGVRLP